MLKYYIKLSTFVNKYYICVYQNGKTINNFNLNAMKKLIDYFTPTTKDDAELGKAMLIITGAILIIIYLANI